MRLLWLKAGWGVKSGSLKHPTRPLPPSLTLSTLPLPETRTGRSPNSGTSRRIGVWDRTTCDVHMGCAHVCMGRYITYIFVYHAGTGWVPAPLPLPPKAKSPLAPLFPPPLLTHLLLRDGHVQPPGQLLRLGGLQHTTACRGEGGRHTFEHTAACRGEGEEE